jgi:tetratricopeptide (TPR) repeat protein
MVRRVLLPVACSLAALVAAPTAARADELDDLQKAIVERPDDAKAYDAFATAALKARRYDDAIRQLKIGVARIPSFPEGYYKLAVAYRQKREWADAADYYRRYIAVDPKRVDPYFGLGASLQGLGDTKGAIAAYEKYIELEKSPAKQRFVDIAKGELEKLRPKPVEAKPAPAPVAVEPVTTLKPPPPPPATATPAPAPAPSPRADAAELAAAAAELKRSGRLEEAVDAFKKAIDANRGNLELYNELGSVYFGLKRYGDAAQTFREVTERDPKFALGWYNLAHALRKGDKKADAVQAYRTYIKLKPDDPDPYYGLGQTLKALGDVSSAIDAFRKYIAMEKRAEEQRWVEKARAELEGLEALQRASQPSAPSGKVEDKDAGDDLVRSAQRRLERDLARDRTAPLSDDIIDPFARSRSPARDLKDPFEREPSRIETKNPFADDMGVLPMSSDSELEPRANAEPATDTVRRYSQALESYRRALSRHVEEVAQRYERGMALALARDGGGATRVWNGVRLDDPQLTAARRGVERVRLLISRR